MALQSTTALATITLQAATSAVTFSGIPSTYRDLIVTLSVKHSYAGSIGVRDNGVRFNSDQGSNYPSVYMLGSGSGTESSTISSTNFQLNYGMASGNFMPSTLQIIDYSATDKHKPLLYRAGSGEDSNYGAYAMTGRWANTTAIHTLTFAPSGSYQFLAGSTFSIYGRIA